MPLTIFGKPRFYTDMEYKSTANVSQGIKRTIDGSAPWYTYAFTNPFPFFFFRMKLCFPLNVYSLKSVPHSHVYALTSKWPYFHALLCFSNSFLHAVRLWQLQRHLRFLRRNILLGHHLVRLQDHQVNETQVKSHVKRKGLEV
jgi:hypothetical protein